MDTASSLDLGLLPALDDTLDELTTILNFEPTALGQDADFLQGERKYIQIRLLLRPFKGGMACEGAAHAHAWHLVGSSESSRSPVCSVSGFSQRSLVPPSLHLQARFKGWTTTARFSLMLTSSKQRGCREARHLPGVAV